MFFSKNLVAAAALFVAVASSSPIAVEEGHEVIKADSDMVCKLAECVLGGAYFPYDCPMPPYVRIPFCSPFGHCLLCAVPTDVLFN